MSVLVQMDAGPQPSIGAAPLHRPAALTPQLEFLGKWRASIAPKLQQLLTVLAGREAAQSMACVQIWTYLPVLTEGRQILKAEQLCLLGDPELQQFHAGCAQEGVTVTQLGPMGKVWESGAVQVVQYAESLSEDTHPRNRLPGELSRRIGECIYLPVYDRTGQVSQGVLAVVELLVKAQACDYMIVANAISCLNHVMEGLQLSISNPHAQQPAAAPAGAAAGSRLGASGGADAAPAAGGAAATGLPHSSSSQHTNMAWGSRGSSGGSLGRTVSMHTFGV